MVPDHMQIGCQNFHNSGVYPYIHVCIYVCICMCMRRLWQPTPVFLPGESPWTEQPGELQSMGCKKVRHDLVTKQQQ